MNTSSSSSSGGGTGGGGEGEFCHNTGTFFDDHAWLVRHIIRVLSDGIASSSSSSSSRIGSASGGGGGSCRVHVRARSRLMHGEEDLVQVRGLCGRDGEGLRILG